MGLLEYIKENRSSKQKEEEDRRKREQEEYQKRLEEEKRRQEEQAQLMKDIRVEFAIKGRELTKRFVDRFAASGKEHKWILSKNEYGKENERKVFVFLDKIMVFAKSQATPQIVEYYCLDSGNVQKVNHEYVQWEFEKDLGYESVSEYFDGNRRILIPEKTTLGWVANDIRASLQKRFPEYDMTKIEKGEYAEKIYYSFTYTERSRQISSWK